MVWPKTHNYVLVVTIFELKKEDEYNYNKATFVMFKYLLRGDLDKQPCSYSVDIYTVTLNWHIYM